MKQQGYTSAHIFPLILASVLLTACSATPFLSDNQDSILRDKSLDYAQSTVIDRISVPAGLNDAQVQNDLLIIPAAQQSVAPAGIEEAPRPDFVFAQAGSHSARLIGGASQQRISVAGSLAKVQGHVAQFWSNQGIAIEKDASDQAVETEWFSLSEKAPSDNFIARWIRSLTKSDEDIAYGRVKVELTEIAPNRVELSLDFLQLTQLEIEDQKEIDWEATGRALDNESEITFELLRHLSQTALVVQKTDETKLYQVPLLGKDQFGRPLVQLNMNYDQALTNVLKAMASFDVGSYDEIAKKIYFTHTSHLRSSQATESASEGVWGWFKDLHSGSKREPGTKVKVNLLGGKDEDTTAERPIYSSDPEIAAKGTSLEDKKGYKVWLGGKVIYVFEDDDQGDVSETGEYTYMGSFQLHFEETLNSVYVQVLNDQGQPARNVYAEEILWRLQQTLAD